MVYSNFRRYIIFRICLIYIRQIGLRINIDQWEPAALNLNHHPMSRHNPMGDVIHCKIYVQDFSRICFDRAVISISIPYWKDISPDKHLISVGVNIDEFYDYVGILCRERQVKFDLKRSLKLDNFINNF